LVVALAHVAFVHLFRREGQNAQAHAETVLTLTREYGFAWWLGVGTSLQGWALVEHAARSEARKQKDTGLIQLREGLAAMRDMGTEMWVPLFLGALAQGYGQGGQVEEGLKESPRRSLAEKNGNAGTKELYRIKGESAMQAN
jgi:hypothetical protein